MKIMRLIIKYKMIKRKEKEKKETNLYNSIIQLEAACIFKV